MYNKEVIEPEEIETAEVITVENIKNNAIATMNNKFVEARYSLTLEEQRILLALISLIQPDDEDFKNYKIPVKLLSELAGTKHKNMYRVVDEATNRLMKRVIKIESIDNDGKKIFKKFAFISYAEYKEGKGYFIISIDKHLKPYLLQLKEKFTRIPLKYIFPLRSTYSIRLYELLKQYENTGFRVDYLPELREMLGIEEHEYKRFEAFERIVLKKAVKEINEKTDIEVSYTKKKTGRKITHIEFKIKKKPETSNEDTLEKIKEKVEKLNQGNTPEMKKSPLQTIDIQGQKQEKKTKYVEVWEEISEYRKKYKKVLEDIAMFISSNTSRHLTENQLLFLLINADREMYDDKMIIDIIKTALKNRKLNNIMGFLINALNIDMKTAKFKELTLTHEKIDEQIFKQKLKQKMIEGKSAREYIKPYWDEFIKPKIEKGEMDKSTALLIRKPLKMAIYDDFENKIYVPVSDKAHKDWLEENYLNKMKEYLKEKFDIDDIAVEVIDRD